MNELLVQIERLQEEWNNGDIDLYQFYEEVIALKDYYKEEAKQ